MPLWLALGLFAVLASLTSAQTVDWSAYGADKHSSKFTPLDQINRTNIDSLKVLWRWTSTDFDRIAEHGLDTGGNNQSTPLAIDGVLYVTTPLNQVAALDGTTGKPLWTYDPQAWQADSWWSFINRGVAYWASGQDKRLLLGTNDARLIALDAATGKPIAAFGDSGQIDLTRGLRRAVPLEQYAVLSPPVICRDVVVVGSSITDWSMEGPPGDVRGFDVRTGKLLWTFHTVPQQGQFGYDTWENNAAETAGATNVWAPMSADEELGYVYLPVSTPTNDFYGGGRLGDNLFGESLVCLNARTGERVWHFQLVHHGLWDYDPPAAPILTDITVDGRAIKAVVQLTKQGYAFVFDRVTGQPVWPIREQAVPQSTAPGERAAPTQPIPTKPPPYEPPGLSADRIIAFTPEIKARTLAHLARYDYGPLYTPPSLRGTVMNPGSGGGADWAGGAIHPDKGLLYVPSHTFPVLVRLNPPWGGGQGLAGFAAFDFTGPDGLPLTRPPYGRITAIDLNTGDHLWVKPTGRGPVDHPLLRGLNLPRLGWARRTFAILTPDLLLVAAHGARSIRTEDPERYSPDDPYLWVFAPEDGALLAEIELPDNAQGGMMSYMANGRQYLAIPTGGRERPAELVVLGLPRPGQVVDPDLALHPRYRRTDADHPQYYQAVRALDRGELDTLDRLLQRYPTLVQARGYQHKAYPAEDFRGATLLHHLAGEPIRTRLPDNGARIAALLLKRGADPQATTQAGLSTLTLVAASRQLPEQGLEQAVLTALLDGGADPRAGRGQVMWQALTKGKTAMGKMLAQRGAPLDLRFAAALGKIQQLKAFFQPDGTLTAEARPTYRPPIARRAWGGSAQAQPVSREALAALSDQEILDEALALAAINGQVEAISLLLDRGADINARPAHIMHSRDRGSTALYKAVDHRQTRAVALLLERGADRSIGAGWANTPPLERARQSGYDAGVRLLEEKAAE